MHFPYDSFTTLRWLHGPESRPGPLSRRRPRAARAYHGLVGFYRALAPFRFVHGYGVFSGEAPRGWCGPPQHGLSSKTMARITSDCVAMCLHAHQMALITPDCAPFRKCGLRTGVAVEGSADGQVWVECTNHRLPSGLGSGASPSTFAPHQPRLDHALWSALTLACRSAAIWSPFTVLADSVTFLANSKRTPLNSALACRSNSRSTATPSGTYIIPRRDQF